jgi:glycine/D-amino acid oxidase-like deaminating enzyme
MGNELGETRKENLRTGEPFWLDTPRISVRKRAELGRHRFDVVVVGTGISGALAAEALTRQGKAVLLVDRRDPARGSTVASTAMIQHEIDVPLTLLRGQIGAVRANKAWRRSVRAVNDLIALTSELGISCQMRPKSTLYLAGDQLDGEALLAEASVRKRAGIVAELIDGESLKEKYGIVRGAAILSKDSASANPAQLTAGLLRVAQKRGAVVASPVEITDFAEFATGVALATSDGRELLAEHAVFCTGYEHLSQMQSSLHHVTSTWAIAASPIGKLPDWMKETIVWEASEPYLYFRTEMSGKIIAGGEDEDADDKNTNIAVLERKAKTIAAKFEAVTGVKTAKPDYRWAAPFSVTKDGLPIIDRVKGHDRVYSVMGFGGNGITFSMIAAQIVSAAIEGKADPDASLFRMR